MSERPIRFQLSRRKGWRMPPNSAKADRTTPYGNHAARALGLTKGQAAKDAHQNYLDHPASAPIRTAAKKYLMGKNIGCWCGLADPCHVDNWLDFLYGPKQPSTPDGAKR
jgi:hypothetical protein